MSIYLELVSFLEERDQYTENEQNTLISSFSKANAIALRIRLPAIE